MRAWTSTELDNLIGWLKPLVGTRLQEVQTSDQDVVLGFYSADGLLWLWIDLNPTRPGVLPWTELPMRLRAHKSPLNLFLRAHFANRVLHDVRREEARVLRLEFAGGADLEIRLYPHRRNVIARANGKQIAWQKPSEAPFSEPAHAEKPRDLTELRAQWTEMRQVKTSRKTPADQKARLEKDLSKKEKALVKVKEELARKKDLPWKAVGDWLKAHQSLDVPHEWEPFVDKRRKLAWNIEECFRRARDLEGKAYGTEQRLEILRGEIARVRQLLAGPASALPAEPERAPPRPLKDLDVNGRTLRLNGDLTCIAGKSAADNLKLLRKARAWDLWVHLRDYPSAHAILFRNKNANVSDAVLQDVFAWFVRNHLGHKFAQASGERFHFLVAQCRFVRPIKGDKLGRVNYSDERVLIYKVP